MTKRTPLQRYLRARDDFESAKLDVREDLIKDAEQTIRAETGPNLSPEERLDIFKSLQAWPRIVLGLYQAELAIAQSARKENGDIEHNDKPSDLAHNVVGDAIDLGPDRVRHLCRKGRSHLKEGMPVKPKISAAAFKEIIHGCNVVARQKPGKV